MSEQRKTHYSVTILAHPDDKDYTNFAFSNEADATALYDLMAESLAARAISLQKRTRIVSETEECETLKRAEEPHEQR